MSGKHFGDVNLSDFVFPKADPADNIFMQNSQPQNPFPIMKPMVYSAENGNRIAGNAADAQNFPGSAGKIMPTFDIDALNRGFREAEYGPDTNFAHLTKMRERGLPGSGTIYDMPVLNYPITTDLVEPNTIPGMQINSIHPVTEGGKSFNPYADYLAGLHSAGTGNANGAVQANMQGPMAPTPLGTQELNQIRLPMQLPGMMPAMVPPFSYGMNTAGGKKKGVKATAYDIMSDFITRIPMFTHEQKVYIYDSMGGYYAEKTQIEVEQMLMDIYRQKVKESGSGTLLEKTYKLLLKEPQIVRNEKPLSDPAKISFRNCTVDLQTQMMVAHSPTSVVTHGLNCDLARYNGQSEDCPVFDKFLDDITGGDPVLKQRLWEVIGYCLTPDRSAKKFILLQGVRDSGKSLFCDLLNDYLPQKKFSALNVHSLKEKFAMGHLGDIALCVSPDLPASPLDTKSASDIKQMTGNDLISAPVKYKNNTQFRFEGKLILTTNYPLLTEQADDAFMQRALVVPFLCTIPEEMQDKDLLNRLRAEKPAIASKALDAYFRLRNNHYKFSGNFTINSSVLYPEEAFDGPEIMPLVYNYLLNYFEKDPAGLVAMESAYEMFSQEISNQFTEKMFSSAFRRLAEEIYGANKIRSYHAGRYENARSSIEGIRFKQMHC